jgi:hypothetical protein
MGDATDAQGHRSGQLDVVIEYALSLSFPLMQPNAARLYLCEGICAVVEVKSDIAAQWNQYEATQAQLLPLRRNWGSGMYFGASPSDAVPIFAVGYEGWKTLEPAKERVDAGKADGILIINHGVYYSKRIQCQGSEFALYAFLLDLEAIMSSMISSKPSFSAYASQ